MCSRNDDPTQHDAPEDVFTFDTTRAGVIESGPDGWDVEASSLGLEPGRFPQVIIVGDREFSLVEATYAPGGDLSYATYKAGTLPMRVYND